ISLFMCLFSMAVSCSLSFALSLHDALPILAGLAGGIGLAFLFEYLDTNIKDTKEVESILGVPALGVVPSRAGRGRRESTPPLSRSEEHTSELQSHLNLVCRLLLEKKKQFKT